MSKARVFSSLVKCAGDDCPNETETDHWTSKKRQREGWFFQRNGDVWCPDHTPEWVEEWRARRAEK